jgi:polar amino acid transport system permease protein
MIPSFVNQFVSLIKDTSLLWFVGVMEFTQTIFATSNRELNVTMELYFFAAVVYFIICYPLTASSRWLERRLGVGER